MSEETKEYKIFILVGSGVLVLEGILICLFSAANVLDDPTSRKGIIIGIAAFSAGVISLLLILAQSKGWTKVRIDERLVKIVYKATFHAYWIMMFVAANLIILDDIFGWSWTSSTEIGYVIASGILTVALSMAIQGESKGPLGW
ncbi:MAG: hypothetical protein ACFFDI_00130 [Promethearchaeota archaeon]